MPRTSKKIEMREKALRNFPVIYNGWPDVKLGPILDSQQLTKMKDLESKLVKFLSTDEPSATERHLSEAALVRLREEISKLAGR